MNKLLFTVLWALVSTLSFPDPARGENPFIPDIYTADPAAIVHGDTVYLYVGHDEAPPNSHYRLNEWLCYSSKDMKTWTAHGPLLSVKDFKWAVRDAYAAHVIEKDGKFYWYVSIEHNASKRGKAIGVAVSDSPTGPFKDARGSALITADMTSRARHGWEDIDPAIFTDKDGTSYLFWGNVNCYYAKLKPNMIELDGPIMPVEIPLFTEAPWIHHHGGLYYLTYASRFPEKTAYATSTSIKGPWTYRGLLAEGAGNCNTMHQSIIEFQDQWYFIYHTGMLPGGDSYRRAVCVDYLYHNPDGTIQRINMTTEGVSLPPMRHTADLNPPLPEWTRLQSFEHPDRFMRHANYQAGLAETPVDPMQDSMWQAREGLSDTDGVSFESVSHPGYFLCRDGAQLKLVEFENTMGYRRSATFMRQEGLADASGLSLTPIDEPDIYLVQSDLELRLVQATTPEDRLNATFKLLEQGGPIGLIDD